MRVGSGRLGEPVDFRRMASAAKANERPVPRRTSAAASARRDAKRAKNRQLWHEMMMSASLLGVKGVDVADLPRAAIIDELLGRALGIWRWTANELDAIAPSDFWIPVFDRSGNVARHDPHHKYRLEREAAAEVERIVALAESLGLADRMIALEEQQTAAIGAALRAACERIGMARDVQAALATALREEIAPLATAKKELAAA